MTKKNEDRTTVCFVLDETGSMAPYKQETIDGFNEYIKKLLKDDNDYAMTLTLFNSQKIEIRYAVEPLEKVKKLNDKTYMPDHMTPLYDALGQSIKSVAKNMKGKKQKVIFVIMTDGEENYSEEYSHRDVFDMIDKKKEKGWAFVFLGANQDAYAVSGALGLHRGSVTSYDQDNTRQAFHAVAKSAIAYASSDGTEVENLIDDEDRKKVGGLRTTSGE